MSNSISYSHALSLGELGSLFAYSGAHEMPVHAVYFVLHCRAMYNFTQSITRNGPEILYKDSLNSDDELCDSHAAHLLFVGSAL